MDNEEKKKQTMATFRYGIISEFVNGAKLEYGEREKLIKQKISRTYDIPYSKRSSLTRATIISWIKKYKKSGFNIEGLRPNVRSDKGKCHALTPELRMAIKDLKKQNPKLKLPALLDELKHRKILGVTEKVNHSSVYRFIRTENLNSLNEDAVDKRCFEASTPNEIWQSDIMYGPNVLIVDRSKKSYLIAIIDDFSRLIIHARFYLTEGIEDFKGALKNAFEVRGLPQKLYIDNGSCYRALSLEYITASLGVAIKHSRPYTPQGRGKIERWFKYVRDNFLPTIRQTLTLDKLNEDLDSWVDTYNNREHGTTKQRPYDRYKKNLECARPAPKNILEYFRTVEYRLVKKDRTFKLNGRIYEAPVALIDRKVELKYHPEEPDKIEIFFNNLSHGSATILDPHVNAKIGRNWDNSKPKTKKYNEQNSDELKPIETGKLFEITIVGGSEV